MADDKNDKVDDKTANSDTKTPEQAKAQSAAKTTAEANAAAGTVELSHGEPSDASKEEAKQAEKSAQDPWGDTPVQMRDQHSPEVDPAKNDPMTNSNTPVREVRVNPMEPGQTPGDDAPEGGTNAPA